MRFEGMLDDRAHVSCFRKWDGTTGTRSAPYIDGIANSATLDLREHLVRLGSEASMTLWARGLGGYSRQDVCVRLDGYDIPVVPMGEPDAKGLVQVNALIPSGMAARVAAVNIAAGGSVSPQVRVELVRAQRTRGRKTQATAEINPSIWTHVAQCTPEPGPKTRSILQAPLQAGLITMSPRASARIG